MIGPAFGVEDVRRAREVVRRYPDRSPLQAAPLLSAELGCDVHLKLELVHPCRVYKVRGAIAKLASLEPAARRRGAVAASAGSHALAVSWAGHELGIPVTVVMPSAASASIARQCESFGAEVLFRGEVYEDAAAYARDIERRESRVYVHPFADPVVVAGQGTIGLEILEQLPSAGAIVAGIGGGGLIGGIATAVKGSGWRGKVYGVEPAGADAMTRSLEAGRIVAVESPRSIADKLVARTTEPFAFELARRYVDGTVRVSEEEIIDAVFRYVDGSPSWWSPPGPSAWPPSARGSWICADGAWSSWCPAATCPLRCSRASSSSRGASVQVGEVALARDVGLPALQVGREMRQQAQGVVRGQDRDAQDVAERDEEDELLDTLRRAAVHEHGLVQENTEEDLLRGAPGAAEAISWHRRSIPQ